MTNVFHFRPGRLHSHRLTPSMLSRTIHSSHTIRLCPMSSLVPSLSGLGQTRHSKNRSRIPLPSRCTRRQFSRSVCRLESLYDVLEIPRTASKHQIKASFYKLSKKYHPDLNLTGKEGAEVKFVAVSNAWSVLGDERKRRAYDRELDQAAKAPSFRPSASSGAGGEDFHRRPRATHAWRHPRSSDFSQSDHPGRRAGGSGHYTRQETGPYHDASPRTPGGRRTTGGSSGRKDPLEGQDQSDRRIQADSGVWRFAQVFGVFWIVTALAGGFSVNAA
ncbi:uncharacterized protein EI90DRAFT_3053035 [Cantharellus anzutake]|uniref:uncharacterized protein n=1 Tax=Cantharellus anzutake TaxID=1750568 RepID=UPI001907878F|nr:uncharacterized protein EI90DRAFT_3053035 [Cantharellus anzutake]KAF8333113.1 hypothetical protein EI90DRAFT_3053035 [Cantharellus anzutake]